MTNELTNKLMNKRTHQIRLGVYVRINGILINYCVVRKWPFKNTFKMEFPFISGTCLEQGWWGPRGSTIPELLREKNCSGIGGRVVGLNVEHNEFQNYKKIIGNKLLLHYPNLRQLSFIFYILFFTINISKAIQIREI